MHRLQALAAQNGPLCVGLDTDPSYLPPHVLSRYGSPAEAVLAYNTEIIRRLQDTGAACCCKVQIAYYEAMGLSGMQTYAQTLRAVRDAGLVCISDVKRGDIAATAGAYARAHFSGDFESDIITVNPYMGFDTLQPFLPYCEQGKGLFVLLRTSNPGMADIENQELASGGPVLNRVADELERLNGQFKAHFPAAGCSPVGAVVGCTEETDALTLRASHPELFFLIPGYGAQGGAARVAAALLQQAGGTVNSSRGILCAWKKDPRCQQKAEYGSLTMADLGEAALSAALSAKQELLATQASFRA